MSKQFRLGLVVLGCAAVFGLAEPAAADGIAMIPRYASLVEVSATAYHQPTRPPFGMETEPATGDVSSKWQAVEAEIEQEEAVLAHCRTEQACPAAARDLLNIIAEGADRPGRARVGLINRAVNLAIIPTSDEAQWGVADHWSPPFETLETRRGDCEDYAIVKYAALRQAGLSRDDMKIVVLHNVVPNEDHAVLAAHVDGEWLILDNRTLALVRDSDIVKAQPKFMLDQDGAHRIIPSDQVTAGIDGALCKPPYKKPERETAIAHRSIYVNCGPTDGKADAAEQWSSTMAQTFRWPSPFQAG
jgi:predicted transglutaminase-like cysteine proteinase